MESSIVQKMMSLMEYAIFHDQKSVNTMAPFAEDEAVALYRISKDHDVAGIVADAVFDLRLIPKGGEIYAKFQKQQMLDLYRYETIHYELAQLSELFEKACIPFIPLKGSVIRQFYPKPWLRTSCDIDFLIRETDVDRALQMIETEVGCSDVVRGTHDVGLVTQNGVHFELHYTLVEEGKLPKAKTVLNRVWEYAYPAEGCQYHHLLKDEMFYYYHIAHMAIHFQGGGCGVRPFIDLQILAGISHDDQARNALLSDGGLTQFEEQVRKLAAVWFGDERHDEETLRVESFIVRSGVYGTSENYIAAQQVKEGNKFKFLLSRLWLPYDVLKNQYPSLNGKKLLLPIYEVRRWFHMLFGGRLKHSLNEIKVSGSISDEKSREVGRLLSQLGLID